MPEWIHNRAEHLLAKNPDMSKSKAFAIATQQSHALGKSPKGYGTAEGKREAKAKYDTPKDDVKKANPGGLDSPKLATLSANLGVRTVMPRGWEHKALDAAYDAMGGSVPAALMHDTRANRSLVHVLQGKPLPGKDYGMGSEAAIGLVNAVPHGGSYRRRVLLPELEAGGKTVTSSALNVAKLAEVNVKRLAERYSKLDKDKLKRIAERVGSAKEKLHGSKIYPLEGKLSPGGSLDMAGGNAYHQGLEALKSARGRYTDLGRARRTALEAMEKDNMVDFTLPPLQHGMGPEELAAAVTFRRALAQHMMAKEAGIFSRLAARVSRAGKAAPEAAAAATSVPPQWAHVADVIGKSTKRVRQAEHPVASIPSQAAGFIGKLRDKVRGVASGAEGVGERVRGVAGEVGRGAGEIGEELGKVKGDLESVVGPFRPAQDYLGPLQHAMAAGRVPEAEKGLGRYWQLLSGSRAAKMKEQMAPLEQSLKGVKAEQGQGWGKFMADAMKDPGLAVENLPGALKAHAEDALLQKAHQLPLSHMRDAAKQEASDVMATRLLTGGGLGAAALGANMWNKPRPPAPAMSSDPNEYAYSPMVRTASADPYLLDQIGKPKIRKTQAEAPDAKYRVKHAFETSQYSGEIGPYPGPPQDKFLPPFRVPQLKTAGPPSEATTEGKKMACMREELEKLNAFSPQTQLSSAQKEGVPKTTAPPGPSIADISKPVGYGMPLAGATKSGTV